MNLDCDQELLDEEFFESLEKKIPTNELNNIRKECGDELYTMSLQEKKDAIFDSNYGIIERSLLL